MLQIEIPENEYWDERALEFVKTKSVKLSLEHSLISISKWEANWCKPFLSPVQKTTEETIDYIRCMTLNQNVDPNAYYMLSRDNIRSVNEYIEAPMSATTFHTRGRGPLGSGRNEQVTSELIYYWMIALNIPFECQKWHLTRLINLIKVCNIKNQPPKKMSKREVLAQNAALNEERRKKWNSKG